MKPSETGLKRIVQAASYSARGIQWAWRHEAAFRQEAVCSMILIPVGFWLGDTAVEKSLLVGSWFVVLMAEILNSAIEAVVDRIGPERHELSGSAKDMASAAVLFALILAAIVWGLVLFESFSGQS